MTTNPFLTAPGGAAAKKRIPGQPGATAGVPGQPGAPSMGPALAPTFAALQKQGVARPASPMGMPIPPQVMYGTQPVPQPPGQPTPMAPPGFADNRMGMPTRPPSAVASSGMLGKLAAQQGQPGQPQTANPLAGMQPSPAPQVLPQGQPPVSYGGAPASAPTAAQPSYGSDMRPEAEAALRDLLENPTGYTDESVQRNYARLAGQIDDEYTINQQDVQNEMARRGLSDSSISAGRLSDLNIGKRSAKTDLADRLVQQMAEATGAGKANATGQALGYGLNQNAQAMAGFQQLFEMMGMENLYPANDEQVASAPSLPQYNSAGKRIVPKEDVYMDAQGKWHFKPGKS